MEIQHDCLACVTDDIVGATRSLNLPKGVAEDVLSGTLAVLRDELSEKNPPSEAITRAHRLLKLRADIEVPWKEQRKRANELGAAIADGMRAELDSLEQGAKLERLIGLVTAANHFDFRTVGIGYEKTNDDFIEEFKKLETQPFVIDQRAEVMKLIQKYHRILYVPDNVGEIALDKLLVEELRKVGKRISLVYRAGPITSDAVKEDFDFFGFESAVDRYFSSGSDTLGLSFRELTPEAASHFEVAALIICKGQANFYEFDHAKNSLRAAIVNLFTIKCDVVRKYIGAESKGKVAMVLRHADD
ncbi:MAG: ARMT1-like domain-containing protein [Planctomycetes bacterium]|nr:ARMT1-like domain-containing protein [Planctomycetota bacterium]